MERKDHPQELKQKWMLGVGQGAGIEGRGRGSRQGLWTAA